MNFTTEQMFEVQDEVMFLSVEDIDRQCPRAVDPNDTELWQTFPFDNNCLESFFHKLTGHLRRYYPWEEWMYTLLYVLISALALVGNGVVILAVIRKREMRTGRNVLIVNLALSNLMLALTTVPFLWLPSIDFDFPYSNFFCKFANALPGSNIYCSTLTISVMAIDRYYSVRSIKITGPAAKSGQCLRAVLISILIWIFALILSFPLLIYYQVNMLYVFKDVYVLENDGGIARGNGTFTMDGKGIILRSYGWRQCRLMTGDAGGNYERSDEEEEWWIVDERMIQLAMSLMQAIMLYAVPLIVISIFNVKLTRFLKMNAKQMRPRTTSTTMNGIGKLIRTESESEEQPFQNTNTRQSVATGQELAADRRRNKTTALLVAMAGSYAVLWLPFSLVSVLIDLDMLGVESGSPIMERVDQTCKLISILSICINPFLYGFLNTNFRHEFNEIFTKCLQYAPAFRQKQIGGGNGKGGRRAVAKNEAYSAIISTQDAMTTVSTMAKLR